MLLIPTDFIISKVARTTRRYDQVARLSIMHEYTILTR